MAKMITQHKSPSKYSSTQSYIHSIDTLAMDSPQQYEVHFPENASPAADVPRSATAFPAHQRIQSAPMSYRRAFPSHPRGYAGVARDAVFPPANAAGNYRPDGDWDPPIENAQGRPLAQDLRNVDMGYYDMANDHPPLHEHRDHAINNYAGVALDVPARAQAAPPVPEVEGPARNAAAGPAQAFPDEWPQGPFPNQQANEVLRQLAILYLREPNSQVAMIRMEPSHAHGIRVVITLDLADL